MRGYAPATRQGLPKVPSSAGASSTVPALSGVLLTFFLLMSHEHITTNFFRGSSKHFLDANATHVESVIAQGAVAAASNAPLPVVSLPAPSRVAAHVLSKEDKVFVATVDQALEEDGDPWVLASAAYEKGRVWPISFSRSKTLFVEPPPPGGLAAALEPAHLAATLASKEKEWTKIMPGNAETAIFKWGEDALYNAEYAASWKARTWVKGGADCNRHLEIVSSGAIPVFRGIRAVSPTTLFAYPKKLMALVEDIAETDANPRHMAVLRHAFLEWGWRHLTAPAMARYMARAAVHMAQSNGRKSPFDAVERGERKARIAFIDSSLPARPDYLSMSVLAGLVEEWGEDNVDVFFRVAYMEIGGPDVDGQNQRLYGLGYGYRQILRAPSKPPEPLDDYVKRLYAGNYYDAIVWGSWSRSAIYYFDPAMIAAYRGRPEYLWLCDGDDGYSGWPAEPGGGPDNKQLRETATIFVREHKDIPWP